MPRLAGMILIFIYMSPCIPVCRDEMSRGVKVIVLNLVQFDFIYSSAIIILNSAFILGLSASRSHPIKLIWNLYDRI